jgi:hypothetical protein
MMEVMAFKNLFGLAIATIRIAPPMKVAQAKHIEILMEGPLENTIGIDGEVFGTRGNGKIEVKFRSHISYLQYNGR